MKYFLRNTLKSDVTHVLFTKIDATKAQSISLPTVIISGRARETVKNFVQIENIMYAGSHGFRVDKTENFPHELAYRKTNFLKMQFGASNKQKHLL